jgi:hypothetical protein
LSLVCESDREQLNQMMLDKSLSPKLSSALASCQLKPGHLSEWKKRGHQDWLLHQDWLADRRIRQESAGDLLDDCDSNKVNQGALQLGTLYIYDALRDLRAGGLESKLGGDSAAFARLLNALSRASRETLQLQKYRDVCDRARAALRELKDPKRKLNQSETRAIVLKVDILGLRSDDPTKQTIHHRPTAVSPFFEFQCVARLCAFATFVAPVFLPHRVHQCSSVVKIKFKGNPMLFFHQTRFRLRLETLPASPDPRWIRPKSIKTAKTSRRAG